MNQSVVKSSIQTSQNSINTKDQNADKADETEIKVDKFLSIVDKKTMPYWLYIGHAACAIGLFAGYHTVCSGGDAVWYRFLRLRRTFLAGAIITGIWSVHWHIKEWDSLNNIGNVMEPADQYSWLWIPRQLHKYIGILIPLSIEYLGPDYAKYAVWTFALQLLTVRIQLIFEKHWMQSLIAQITQNKKNINKDNQKQNQIKSNKNDNVTTRTYYD